MSNDQILEQLSNSTKGIESIQRSVDLMKSDIAQTKDDIKELKLNLGKLDVKVSGIDTRLGNEETISRNALGIVAGGTMLAVTKYLFFGS
jgi:peptidoglycan hydrolase CwlO-like protein